MRLGILGGTFDPVHLAHLILADQAREVLELDRVLLVPAALPPHKPGRRITEYAVRLEMLGLALAGVEGLVPSELERDPTQPSYTAETLRRVQQENPDLTALWLLLGGDSLEELSTWREPEAVVRLARLAVYPRPGWGAGFGPDSDPERRRQIESWEATGRLRFLAGPPFRLSASEIRERVRAGRSIRFLVPEPVRDYILRTGLYRSDERRLDSGSENDHG